MSMQDPLADMFTRIRNAHAMLHPKVSMAGSKLKSAVAQVLLDEGYIKHFSTEKVDGKPLLEIELQYMDGQKVIQMLRRISKPSLRIYRSHQQIPVVNNGLGVAIVSTSQGVMSDKRARQLQVGGEVLATVF